MRTKPFTITWTTSVFTFDICEKVILMDVLRDDGDRFYLLPASSVDTAFSNEISRESFYRMISAQEFNIQNGGNRWFAPICPRICTENCRFCRNSGSFMQFLHFSHTCAIWRLYSIIKVCNRALTSPTRSNDFRYIRLIVVDKLQIVLFQTFMAKSPYQHTNLVSWLRIISISVRFIFF